MGNLEFQPFHPFVEDDWDEDLSWSKLGLPPVKELGRRLEDDFPETHETRLEFDLKCDPGREMATFQQQQQQMMYEQTKRNLKEHMHLLNQVSDRCFTQCVSTAFNFGQEDKNKEVQCFDTCVGKFLSYNQRLSLVFAEYDARLKKSQMLQAQQASNKGQSSQPSASDLSTQTPSASQAVTMDTTQTEAVTKAHPPSSEIITTETGSVSK